MKVGDMTYKRYKTSEEWSVCEVINGEIISHEHVITQEQRNVCANLLTEFGKYSRGKELKVYPYVDIYIFENPNGEWIDENVRTWVISDFSVICDENKVKKHGIVGAPELVVEVINVHTAKLDRFDKFKLYESAGVREYLIVDPLNQTIESYGMDNGRLELKEVFGRNHMFRSQLFADLVINLKDIF
ncbi:Uma2 family endonuclease [Bacillus cereus group sp. BceL297]|uniref:Uma2 family endonuclease n=1 Tax=unclassified Bacillus cereus group TaxID=2750818 RepID=UPI003F2896C5